MILPDCMMPDGAAPCVGYTELQRERDDLREALRFARTQLWAVRTQFNPRDDAIIMRHVEDAYRRINEVLREYERAMGER